MFELFIILTPALWIFALCGAIADLIDWLQKKKVPRGSPQRHNENMFK